MPSCLPSSCNGCPLHQENKHFVPFSGLAKRKILIVGEAPGEQEAREGMPFVGTSGKLLDRLLKLTGLSRDDFAVHNVLSCRPPNNELRGTFYEQQAIEHCRENLDKTIREIRPKVIIALGNVPLERLTGFSGITRHRGYPLRGPFDTWVIPTYHPSYLLPRRGQKSTSHLTPAVIRDIKLAVAIAENGYERPIPKYLEDPPVGKAWDFYKEWTKDGYPDLSIDIETPYKLTVGDEESFDELDTQIIRIGYCFKPGYAMSIPFTPEYFQIHRAFLQAEQGRKVFWNGYHFDVPIIQENGLQVKGVIIDAMWAWHYLQPDMPRGLESVGSFYFNGLPWKHLSKENPARYNAIDVDCALQNWRGIENGLKKKGQLEGFFEFVVELDPFLQEAGINGVRIDAKARRVLYKKLRKEEKRLIHEIQQFVPESLRPRKRYKKFPKDLREGETWLPTTVTGKIKRCTHCGAEGVSKTKHFKGGKRNPCKVARGGIEIAEGVVTEWDKLLEFNPLSSDQLIKYCQHFGLPVGKHPKSGNPTVDDDHLEVLIKKHGTEYPIFSLVQDLRTISKSISTYVVGLKPNNCGVVQTQYTYAPATGRLSSKGLQRGSDRGVNLQNIPHRGDHPYASEIRQMIIPHEGYCFVEADSSAIEAVMVGYFMGGIDDPYVKMAQRGIHDAFSLHSRGEELTDANISKFKKLAKVQGSPEMIMRDRKKRTVHAANYDEGPGLITKQYPKDFPTFLDAKRELAAYHQFVPGLKKWHHQTRVQAHETTYLQLPFGGYRRYFYDVFTYDKDKSGNIIMKENGLPKIKLGEDGKSCIAQRPQGSAAMFMRQNALRIAKEIKDRNLPFRIPGHFLIHDSYCLEVPIAMRDVAVKLLIKHLTRAIPEMDGLRIGCEVKVGMKNWDDMEVVETIKI